MDAIGEMFVLVAVLVGVTIIIYLYQQLRTQHRARDIAAEFKRWEDRVEANKRLYQQRARRTKER